MAYVDPNKKVLDRNKPVADREVPATKVPGNDLTEYATYSPGRATPPKPSSKK